MLLNTKAAISPALFEPSLHLLLKNPRQNMFLPKHDYLYCQVRNYVCGRIDNPPMLN